jgi:hypothetical protein
MSHDQKGSKYHGNLFKMGFLLMLFRSTYKKTTVHARYAKAS